MENKHFKFLLLISFFVFNFFITTNVQAKSNITVRMGLNRTCDSNNNCSNVQSTDQNTGGEVSVLQHFLKDAGYLDPNTNTTGRFGSLTSRALQHFQTDNHISPSGQTGPNTVSAINADISQQVIPVSKSVINSNTRSVTTPTANTNSSVADDAPVQVNANNPAVSSVPQEINRQRVTGIPAQDSDNPTTAIQNISNQPTGNLIRNAWSWFTGASNPTSAGPTTGTTRTLTQPAQIVPETARRVINDGSDGKPPVVDIPLSGNNGRGDATTENQPSSIVPRPIIVIQQQGTTVSSYSDAQFQAALNSAVSDGTSLISPKFNEYVRANFDDHSKISDADILKIKGILLEQIKNGSNNELKALFEGKAPEDVKVGPYFETIELTLPENKNGQPVGASFKPDGSVPDTDLHKNGLAAPALPSQTPKDPLGDLIQQKTKEQEARDAAAAAIPGGDKGGSAVTPPLSSDLPTGGIVTSIFCFITGGCGTRTDGGAPVEDRNLLPTEQTQIIPETAKRVINDGSDGKPPVVDIPLSGSNQTTQTNTPPSQTPTEATPKDPLGDLIQQKTKEQDARDAAANAAAEDPWYLFTTPSNTTSAANPQPAVTPEAIDAFNGTPPAGTTEQDLLKGTNDTPTAKTPVDTAKSPDVNPIKGDSTDPFGLPQEMTDTQKAADQAAADAASGEAWYLFTNPSTPTPSGDSGNLPTGNVFEGIAKWYTDTFGTTPQTPTETPKEVVPPVDSAAIDAFNGTDAKPVEPTPSEPVVKSQTEIDSNYAPGETPTPVFTPKQEPQTFIESAVCLVFGIGCDNNDTYPVQSEGAPVSPNNQGDSATDGTANSEDTTAPATSVGTTDRTVTPVEVQVTNLPSTETAQTQETSVSATLGNIVDTAAQAVTTVIPDNINAVTGAIGDFARSLFGGKTETQPAATTERPVVEVVLPGAEQNVNSAVQEETEVIPKSAPSPEVSGNSNPSGSENSGSGVGGESGSTGDSSSGSDSGGGGGGGDSGGGYGGGDSGGGGGGGCFIAGTKVLMADLSLKNIEDVVVGDSVMTQIGTSKVSALKKYAYDGDIYAYNNSGKFFFTPNHPFLTTDGWKSFDPKTSMKESPNLVVKLAGSGDTLIKVSSQEKIVSVQKKHTHEFVYNFTVQGSHTYFANDYLVHNIKTTDGGGGFWEDIFDLFSW